MVWEGTLPKPSLIWCEIIEKEIGEYQDRNEEE
jgi:hypothetical protein